MLERAIGALIGLSFVGLLLLCAKIPHVWAIVVPVVGVIGWGFGGYVRNLRKQAERDELTGMANRRPFERALQYHWQRSIRTTDPISLLFIDLDDFGAINKRYGHLIGDEALKLVSREIRRTVRHSDVVSRWGGEEFVILLPGTGAEEAYLIAERIRSIVQQCQMRDRDRDRAIAITVSAGVATNPGKASSAQELLRQAISAQNTAKRSKNAVEVVS
jgi:diguanylate cyclase (GGDEF)-like protein